VAEITNLLSSAHTSAILSEYNHGNLLAISFRIQTEFGLVPFRMPANVEGVFGVLARSERIPKKFRTREQASCVAWRIVKGWLEVQLAMVQAGLVKFEQVFLPYAQDPKTGMHYFMPPDHVLVASTALQNRFVYGRVTQVDGSGQMLQGYSIQDFQAARVPQYVVEAKRLKAEMELAHARNQLIEKRLVERQLAYLLVGMRQKMLLLPGKLRMRLVRAFHTKCLWALSRW